MGALYLALAPAVTGNKDASEFTLTLALMGVAHPTGYPLYTLAGHGFVVLLHQLGASWAYAANAWSAVGGAVAMALHHALAARIVPPTAPLGRGTRFVLALLATAMIGLNPVWLIDAMQAEVYSWHLAWVCGISLAALGLIRALAPRQTEWTSRRLAFAAAAWGALCGTGMAHHATAVWFIAPLSVAIVVAVLLARRGRWWLPVVAAAAALVPLASYLLLAFRASHPAIYQWPRLEPSLASLVRHVSGAEYRDLFGRFAPGEAQAYLLRSFAYPLLFPTLAGLLWATLRARPRAERTILWGLLAAAGLQTLYSFSYGVLDPSSYFQPSLAIGLLAVPLLGAGLTRSRRALPALGLAAALLVTGLGVVWVRFGFEIRAGLVEVERHVHDLWRSIPFERGIVLWREDRYATLLTYQILDGERPGLYVSDPAVLSWNTQRRAFKTRFGFDPLDGLTPLTTAKTVLIPENINRLTALPVAVFDPGQAMVHVLPKGAGSVGGAAR